VSNSTVDAIHVPLNLPADRVADRIGSWDRAALLEGGPSFGDAGRWSIYAAEPRLTISGHADGLIGCLGTTLDREVPRILTPDLDDPDACPFQGGWIGYFGYDLAPAFERIERRNATDSNLPDYQFGLYDTCVTADHRRGTTTLSAYALRPEHRADLASRVDRWMEHLHARSESSEPFLVTGPVEPDRTRDDYLEGVRRALEYIRAGDIFQVNLSQRFSTHGRGDLHALHRRFRSASPAPFSAFLRTGEDSAILSASPESFYQTRGNRIVTRPIKGTRPRGASADEDAHLIEELINSPKDRAELTMIVDLERNDLGRVCEYGSVRVSEAMAVESFAQVHHLVATIEGRLRPEITSMDVVKAMFPGGSITGAPKIRAMQIIDELETNQRGVYTGAIGYLSRGASAFNIAIRTMIAEDGRITYQVGGGIVADSDPEAEYEETLHKGRAMREVLERLERTS
jgi:para-aminobenzoate synthetase component 1